MAIGRDQVALLSLYVLAGFVLAHLGHGRAAPLARMRASLEPLAAAGVSAALVAAVPIIMTTLLAARSNRPEISYASAAAGSLHPVHLLQFAFADLYGAMDPRDRILGAAEPDLGCGLGMARASTSRRTWGCSMPAR